MPWASGSGALDSSAIGVRVRRTWLRSVGKVRGFSRSQPKTSMFVSRFTIRGDPLRSRSRTSDQ